MTSNCFFKAYSCAFKKSLISILKIWYYVWDSHDFGWFFATRIRIRIVDTNATISKSISLLRKLSKNDIKQINLFNKKKEFKCLENPMFYNNTNTKVQFEIKRKLSLITYLLPLGLSVLPLVLEFGEGNGPSSRTFEEGVNHFPWSD